MVKFLAEWEKYRAQIDEMDMSSKKKIKESIMDPSLDEMMVDKLNEEQMDTLKEFKQVVYDNEKYKKYNKPE